MSDLKCSSFWSRQNQGDCVCYRTSQGYIRSCYYSGCFLFGFSFLSERILGVTFVQDLSFNYILNESPEVSFSLAKHLHSCALTFQPLTAPPPHTHTYISVRALFSHMSQSCLRVLPFKKQLSLQLLLVRHWVSVKSQIVRDSISIKIWFDLLWFDWTSDAVCIVLVI